jgi:hypothetical protein
VVAPVVDEHDEFSRGGGAGKRERNDGVGLDGGAVLERGAVGAGDRDGVIAAFFERSGDDL